MIKAKPTEFKGIRYRSRLEARWAVFFDALGIEFQYEPRKFEFTREWEIALNPLGNVGYYDLRFRRQMKERLAYVPDFYVPAFKTWFEVKPRNPTAEEVAKCELLKKHRPDERVVLLAGPPYRDNMKAVHRVWNVSNKPNGLSDWSRYVYSQSYCFGTRNGQAVFLGWWEMCDWTDPIPVEARHWEGPICDRRYVERFTFNDWIGWACSNEITKAYYRSRWCTPEALTV